MLPAILVAVLSFVDAASVAESLLAYDPIKMSFKRQLKYKRHTDLGIANLQYDTYSYYATLKLGSQAQELDFIVDTGSSDMWVPADLFDYNSSSTWKYNEEPFSIVYGDGSGATGYYGTDTVRFGSTCSCKGLTLKDFQFAVADNVTGSSGYVLGIGLSNNEGTVARDFNTGQVSSTYDNFPSALKEQGLIQSTLYSVWLDTQEANDGDIVFGGVDHAKYTGTLAKMPFIVLTELVLPEYRLFTPTVPDRFVVVLNGISLQNSAGDSQDVASGASLPVLIDSGTALGLLPPDILEAIATTLNATYLEDLGYYTVTDVPSGSITFTLAGVPIAIPLSTWIRPLDLGDGPISVLGSANGNLLGGTDTAQIDNGIMYILGAAFMGGAYTVFDIDNMELGIAQAKSGVKEEDFEIASAGIPRATQAPSYSFTSTNTEYQLSTPTGLY